ncbi:DUF805 domain-containing protein [Sphingomonas sp. ABOLE]|uniref:DUF805 domain-containing protein n=1 Tax=Sphingomonas sp. ABOLE TaxID=1985878 RepID=UPI0013DF5900|nr:DUF805 domain-containing protein [Sphingomonas sp. ABOLE]
MSSVAAASRLSVRSALKPVAGALAFDGRSTRSEVWSFWLLTAALSLVRVDVTSIPLLTVVYTLLCGFWSWLWIPLTVRRLHDQDLSGKLAWFLLIIPAGFALIWITAPHGADYTLAFDNGIVSLRRTAAWSPLAAVIVAIIAAGAVLQMIILMRPGTVGANRFGPDPRLVPARPDYTGMSLYERLHHSDKREAFDRAIARGDRSALTALLRELDMENVDWVVDAAMKR